MFKIKDLMIQIIPDESERAIVGPNDGTAAGWCLFTCDGCSFRTCVGCSGCSPPSGGDLNPGDERINPGDLPALKAQLKRRLAVVEAMETSLEPQTFAEAEAVERKLVEALAEVKKIKAHLAPEKREAK